MTRLQRLSLDNVVVFDDDDGITELRVPERVECLVLGDTMPLGPLLGAGPHLVGLTELRAYAHLCKEADLSRLQALQTLTLVTPDDPASKTPVPNLTTLPNLTAVTLAGRGAVVLPFRVPLLPPSLRSLCFHGPTVNLFPAMSALPDNCRVCLTPACTVQGFDVCYSSKITACPFPNGITDDAIFCVLHRLPV